MTDMTAVCALCATDPVYADLLYCIGCIAQIREQSRCPDCASHGDIAVYAGRQGITSIIEHSPTCPIWREKREAGELTEIRYIEGTPQQ